MSIIQSKQPAAPPNYDVIVTYRRNWDTTNPYEARTARHVAFFVLGVIDSHS